ncbi:MAG: 4'-phosphopantetheinyl transferase superfamily protein [Paludibacteraceae bacterium]|nr:4'-phosphopantetheinyl transferase superfamily protein [Paludibacteraceae bacterium]
MFYKVEDIPDEQTMQAVVAELLPLVPFARREKALRYRHLHGQYCCLRAWAMLHELLIAHSFLPAQFPLSDLTYTEDAYGKPYFSAAVFALLAQRSFSVAVCFSLSHTKCAIAVAIDRRPVGIDVESLASARRLEPVFLDRTMNADEQARIRKAADSESACLTFTELWTRKEALVKALGTGLNINTLPDLLGRQTGFDLRTFHTASYACSIAVTEM